MPVGFRQLLSVRALGYPPQGLSHRAGLAQALSPALQLMTTVIYPRNTRNDTKTIALG